MAYNVPRNFPTKYLSRGEAAHPTAAPTMTPTQAPADEAMISLTHSTGLSFTLIDPKAAPPAASEGPPHNRPDGDGPDMTERAGDPAYERAGGNAEGRAVRSQPEGLPLAQAVVP